MEIVAAENVAQLAQVRSLLEEYWAAYGFASTFQNFDDELADLPGAYRPPGGRLGLLLVKEDPAGCVALRRLDARHGEAKRLYVRPRYRRCGAGAALLNWVIEEARRVGYRELVGDTMPQMTSALAMYDRMGFERTGPYSAHPTPGAVFVRLKL